ncbi:MULTISPECIES: hypothetical protein [Nonomuraea]|uniref:Uncharacterized protein n=1 Tax=Nonomuraea mangrovi TaxID=2316207 RepID=A0ABW4SRY4_9ACTN
MRDAFARVAEPERVLVFITEVAEIAAVRGERPGFGSHGITNESLKLISGFRERDERLPMCDQHDPLADPGNGGGFAGVGLGGLVNTRDRRRETWGSSPARPCSPTRRIAASRISVRFSDMAVHRK